jgi:hypothetical protein
MSDGNETSASQTSRQVENLIGVPEYYEVDAATRGKRPIRR